MFVETPSPCNKWQNSASYLWQWENDSSLLNSWPKTGKPRYSCRSSCTRTFRTGTQSLLQCDRRRTTQWCKWAWRWWTGYAFSWLFLARSCKQGQTVVVQSFGEQLAKLRSTWWPLESAKRRQCSILECNRERKLHFPVDQWYRLIKQWCLFGLWSRSPRYDW